MKIIVPTPIVGPRDEGGRKIPVILVHKELTTTMFDSKENNLI